MYLDENWWGRVPSGTDAYARECRLQTRLTTYKCKKANIFFILLTICFLSRQKPRQDRSSASLSQIAPSFNVFVQYDCITFSGWFIHDSQIFLHDLTCHTMRSKSQEFGPCLVRRLATLQDSRVRCSRIFTLYRSNTQQQRSDKV